MAKRKPDASDTIELEMRCATAIDEPLLAPHELMGTQTILSYPSGSEVVAVFTTGAILRMPDKVMAWSPFDTTQIVRFDHDFSMHANEICVCVTLSATYVAASSLDHNTLHIWSCTTGKRLCSLPCGGHICHVQLAATWCVLVLSDPTKPGQTYISCFAWFHPEMGPVLMRYKHIRNITQLVFDTHIPTLCWFVSEMGVFSFDVSLPAHLIAPILVLVDPLITWWPFTQAYRGNVMQYQRVICKYHALSPEEKQKCRTTTFVQPQHPMAGFLCDFAYTAIAPDYVPCCINSGDASDQEMCITTQSQAIIINKLTFKLHFVEIQPYLSVLHICKGMLIVLTDSSDVYVLCYQKHMTNLNVIPIWLEKPASVFNHKAMVAGATPHSCWLHTGSNQIFLVGPQ